MTDDPATRTAATVRGRGDAAGASAGDELAPGTRVDRYLVLDKLDTGGMGTVYAAFDPGLDRKVALKVLHEGKLGGAARDLLLREAKALARLRHGNVVSVHDVGALPDGRLFMTIDLVSGVNLRVWSRQRERSWRELVAVFAQAGRGLAAAHA